MDDLWKIRLKKQMTVAQLSARAGIPARLLHEYEEGARSVPMRNLEAIAKALYVDVMDIKALSDPIPANLTDEVRPPRRAAEDEPQRPAAPPAARPSEPRSAPPYGGRERPPRREPRGPSKARESQVQHLLSLAQLFEWDQAALEREMGTPLAQLDRMEASRWLKVLQERIVTERPKGAKKRRPYLPESVDAFELHYLQDRQDTEKPLDFVLFNGDKLTGRVIGFGPYNITVVTPDGAEVTLNKLAIAYYTGEE
ncbi:MAG: helix-turn-helix transcriptional regulator [Chloroflexi bacterium]|nr:helix-turn-helix transcriptional regulator [Chloroflexota bacterium]